MRKSCFFIASALIALSLSGCGLSEWLHESAENAQPTFDKLPTAISVLKATVTPAVTAAVAYYSLPTCSEPLAGPLCKEKSIVAKMRSARKTAETSIANAEDAAALAKTTQEKAKAQDLYGTAKSAVATFKALADFFNPKPTVVIENAD